MNKTPQKLQIEALTDDSDSDSESDIHTLDYAASNTNRFSNFIEKMDSLERENEILKARIADSENEKKQYIEQTYVKEISDARLLLDEMANDKAKVELEKSRFENELKERNQENAKIKADHDIAIKRFDDEKKNWQVIQPKI